MPVPASDPRIAELRRQGVPVPETGGWKITHFGQIEGGQWLITITGSSYHGIKEEAKGYGATIPEACVRLAAALKQSLRPREEVYAEQAERARASLREMPAWFRRNMCCDPCNAGQHGFCNGSHASGAGGCSCIGLYPETAKGHPVYKT